MNPPRRDSSSHSSSCSPINPRVGTTTGYYSLHKGTPSEMSTSYYSGVAAKTMADASDDTIEGTKDTRGYQSGVHTRPSLRLNSGDTSGIMKVFEKNGPSERGGTGFMNDHPGKAALVVRAASTAVRKVPVVVDTNLAVAGSLSVKGDMGVESKLSQLRAHRIRLEPDEYTTPGYTVPTDAEQGDFCLAIQGGECGTADVNGVYPISNNLLKSTSKKATGSQWNKLTHDGDGLRFTSHAKSATEVELLRLSTNVNAPENTVVLKSNAANRIEFNDSGVVLNSNAANLIAMNATGVLLKSNADNRIELNNAGVTLADIWPIRTPYSPAVIEEGVEVTAEVLEVPANVKSILTLIDGTMQLQTGGVNTAPGVQGVGTSAYMGQGKISLNATDVGDGVNTSSTTMFKAQGPINMHQLTSTAEGVMNVSTTSTKDFTLASTGTYTPTQILPVWPVSANPTSGGLTITLHHLLGILFSFFKQDTNASINTRRDYFSEDYVNMPEHETVEKEFQEALELESQSLSARDLRTAITIVNRKINAVMGLTPPETVNSIKELAERLGSISSDVGYSVSAELASLQAQISNIYKVLGSSFPPELPDVDFATYLLSTDLFMGTIETRTTSTAVVFAGKYASAPRVLFYSKRGAEILSQLTASDYTGGFSEILTGTGKLVPFYRLHNYFLGGAGVERVKTDVSERPIQETNGKGDVIFDAGGIAYISLDGKSGFFYDINMQRYVYCDGLDMHNSDGNVQARVPSTRVYKSIWNETAPLSPMREYETDAFFHSYGQNITGGIMGIQPKKLVVEDDEPSHVPHDILMTDDGVGGRVARKVSMLITASLPSEGVSMTDYIMPIMPHGKSTSLSTFEIEVSLDFAKSMWRNELSTTVNYNSAGAVVTNKGLEGYLSFLMGSFINLNDPRPTIKIPNIYAGVDYIDTITAVTTLRALLSNPTGQYMSWLWKINNLDVSIKFTVSVPDGCDMPMVKITRFYKSGWGDMSRKIMDAFKTTDRSDAELMAEINDLKAAGGVTVQEFIAPLFQDIYKPDVFANSTEADAATYLVAPEIKVPAGTTVTTYGANIRFRALFDIGLPGSPLIVAKYSPSTTELKNANGKNIYYDTNGYDIPMNLDGQLLDAWNNVVLDGANPVLVESIAGAQKSYVPDATLINAPAMTTGVVSGQSLHIVKSSSDAGQYNLSLLSGIDSTSTAQVPDTLANFEMNANHSGLIGAYSAAPLLMKVAADFLPYSPTPPTRADNSLVTLLPVP